MRRRMRSRPALDLQAGSIHMYICMSVYSFSVSLVALPLAGVSCQSVCRR